MNSNSPEAIAMVIYIASKTPLAGVNIPADFFTLSRSKTKLKQTGIRTTIFNISEAVIMAIQFSNSIEIDFDCSPSRNLQSL